MQTTGLGFMDNLLPMEDEQDIKIYCGCSSNYGLKVVCRITGCLRVYALKQVVKLYGQAIEGAETHTIINTEMDLLEADSNLAQY